ncbi:N-6 DNA methylase [Adlercreutzia sp. ZJ138]|uniref:N-6 DNA methylase n=1 Tax=Adlercreutzia sp. ZJ138 TaxID=2709405 RepID=UPI0013EC1BEF|nr:N-6 DNA methylase [Adlercreutzia sp. ZJ138]
MSESENENGIIIPPAVSGLIESLAKYLDGRSHDGATVVGISREVLAPAQPQTGTAGRPEPFSLVKGALERMGDDSFAVLALPTYALVSSHVEEFPIRRDLIQEGRVYAVMALPGRLFDNTSAVAHLLVIGPARPNDRAKATLFVDAQELGCDVNGSLKRTLPAEVANRIFAAFKQFMEQGRERQMRFSLTANVDGIEDRKFDLLPSRFVFAPEKLREADGEPLKRGVAELLDELQRQTKAINDHEKALVSRIREVLS